MTDAGVLRSSGVFGKAWHLAPFPLKYLGSVGSVKDAAARIGDWLVTVSSVWGCCPLQTLGTRW